MSGPIGLVSLVGRDPLAHARLAGSAIVFVGAVDALLSAGLPVTVLVGPGRHAPVSTALTGGRGRVVVTEFLDLASAGLVVVHDPLCPLVPAAYIRRMLDDHEPGTASVAVRPVVDTVKAASRGVISGTVDRDRLRIVSSPLVLPAEVVRELPDAGEALTDLPAFVQLVRRRMRVRLVHAPSAARRIEDASSLQLVDAINAVGHRVRER